MFIKLFLCVCIVATAWSIPLAKENERENGDVVFLGDSITAGWGGNGKPVWDQYFAPLGAVNRGVSGDVTQQTIDRINSGTIDNLPGKVAVLKIGTNDLSRNLAVDYVADQIGIILTLIKANLPDVKIILLAILPRNGEEIHGRIHQVNNLIKSYDNGDWVRYLDMESQFSSVLGQVDPELFYDGLHLTLKGYEVWQRTMAPLFEELINSSK